MATSVRYQRMRLILNSPWNQDGKTSEDWGVTFSLSGASNLLANEMEPTALDLWDPFKQLCATVTYLKGWRFYPIEGHSATGLQDYTSAQHPCTASAFAAASSYKQQLEVCFLAHCSIGKSATGKPVYLRKWMHSAVADTTGNTIPLFQGGVTQATIFAKWNTGSGPRSLVPVSPTLGTQGGPWALETQLHTHQLRKGPKRKKTTTTVYVPVPVP